MSQPSPSKLIQAQLSVEQIYQKYLHPTNENDRGIEVQHEQTTKAVSFSALLNIFDYSNLQRIHVSQPYFDYLKSGQKTVEGRVNKSPYDLLKVGQAVEFYTDPAQNQRSDECKFSALIKAIRPYSSFSRMVEVENVHEKLLPNCSSVEAGVAIYRQFYSKVQEQSAGVLALEISLI